MALSEQPITRARPASIGLLGFVIDRPDARPARQAVLEAPTVVSMREGRCLDNFLRVGLFACAAGMAAATVWLGSTDKTGAAIVAAGLCIGLCTFVFLSRFKRFKGFGFEGELWEQEMEEAAEMRRALKDLTEHVAENVYWDLGEGGRLGRKNTDKILAIIERADQNLEAVGVDRRKIEEMKRPWHKCIMRDLAFPITERVRDISREKLNTVHAEIAALGAAITANNKPQHDALSQQRQALEQAPKQLQGVIWRDDYENVPDLLRQAIDATQWLTDEDRGIVYADCADEFRDIEQYANDRTVRRPEVLKL